MHQLLIVEPDTDLRRELVRFARAAGHRPAAVPTHRAALDRVQTEHFDGLLLDLPGPEELERLGALRAAAPYAAIVAISAGASSRLAIDAVRLGAAELLPKPLSLSMLESALSRALEARGAHALPEPSFVTWDPATSRVLRLAEACAANDATLLFEGESGTGKTLLARHVHARSGRRWAPLVVLDPTDPEGLIELDSEVHAGTVLIQGIGDASDRFQRSLLELLQPDRSVVASVRPRILATTRHPLRSEAAQGRLRPELALRLCVLPLPIPPLRERPGDIGPLTRHLVSRHAAARGISPPRVTADAIEALSSRPLRGNVRELENLVRRLVLLRPAAEIDATALYGSMPAGAEPNANLNLQQLERSAIEHSLAHYDNNRTHASRALGISVRTLRNKIRRYGLGA